MNRLFIIIGVVFVFSNSIFGQSVENSDTIQVDINHADVFKAINNDSLRMLIGNVMLTQQEDEITFACDSANLFERSKSFTAFGNIHLQQGDSIDIYSDEMMYDGGSRIAYLYNNVHLTDKTSNIYSDTLIYNVQTRKAILFKGVDITDNKVEIYADSLEYFTNTKKAFLYDNVVLKDDSSTITSNYMDYDMRKEEGNYKGGGKLVSKQTTLVSQNANYKSKSNMVVFTDNVVLTDPEYVLKSEKLVYNTTTELANFNGETTIVNNQTTIKTNKGYYDQKNQKIVLQDNPIVESENNYLKADSLFFNQKTGKGYAFNNVVWKDTSQNLSIKSQYIEFDDSTEYVMATKRPLMEQVIENDTLFLVADTLVTLKTSDSLRVFTAYGDVRMFKTDFQGICDSLGYSSIDSAFRFYDNPVLWLEDTQLYADTIILETQNNNPSHFSLKNYAFIGNDTGDSVFNQIKGKYIDGFFVGEELKTIKVKHDGESIYFAQDDMLAYIGANKAKAPFINIFLEDQKIQKITFIDNPEAKFETMKSINPYTFKLSGFEWKSNLRPMSLSDLFTEREQSNTNVIIRNNPQHKKSIESNNQSPSLPNSGKRIINTKAKQP